MLQAADGTEHLPRELSFANAMQNMAASWVILPTLGTSATHTLVMTQLEGLCLQLVGKRPNRIEPRAVKRRPKPIRLLNMKREKAREILMRGIDPYKKRK